jgi:hypothetical protein
VSDAEEVLASQIRMAGLPEPCREYKFHAKRKWRFDFAFVGMGNYGRGLAVEVEGAVYAQGRHTRGSGFSTDCEKYNEAALMHWVVLRVTSAMVYSGEALTLIEKALGRNPSHLS